MKLIGKLAVINLIMMCFLFLKSEAQDNSFSNTETSIEIPELALLSLKSTSSGLVTLSPNAPNEAGASMNFSQARSSDIWVNYSSISKNGGISSRHLDAVVYGILPQGLHLKLLASADAGFGKGNIGSPTGVITLSDKEQPIISGIGSCFTGAGINKGHQLTYFLEFNDENLYSVLEQTSINLTVTFTLSSGD
jgi:hypothetical protein